MERSVSMTSGTDEHAGVRGVRQTTPPGEGPRAGRLEELFVQSAPAALRLAYFLTGQHEVAEDLVQDAFVRVAGRFRYLRVPDAFDAYLRRTIVNLAMSHRRRQRLERAHLAREGTAELHTTSLPDPAERDHLWRALLELPERQRAALVLRFYEDLSEREAAAILGCSPGALNQLVVRAMASLREHIGKDER
jgi:RNA polymerase sigma-70 factor (sigma-E family)